MAQISAISKVGIGIEATPGTKAATIVWIPVQDFNPVPKTEVVKDDSGLGRIESATRSDIVRKWSEPTLSAIAYDVVSGILLKSTLGTNSTATGVPEVGVNTHSLTVKNDNNPVTVTLVYVDGVRTEMITGAIVNTATFNYVQNDYLKVDLTFMGNAAVTTADTPVFTEENSFIGGQTSVKLATNVAGLPAAAVAPFENATFVIDKQAELRWELGSTTPVKLLNRRFLVNGTFTSTFENTTYRDLFVNGTTQAIRFDATNTAVTIGTATNPQFTIDFDQVTVDDWTESSGNVDIKTQDFGFSGTYSLANASMLSATLVNTGTIA